MMIDEDEHRVIWTIGHSTHTADEFLAILQSFQIERLADIRRFPGSRRYPHFNRAALEDLLSGNGIRYTSFTELGGRRRARPDSVNTAWRNAAFKGYADYMETDEFKEAIQRLESMALKERTAYMCSEAVWWSCHRALVSDFLKLNNWKVMHILGEGKAQEHPYTSAAKTGGGQLSYRV